MGDALPRALRRFNNYDGFGIEGDHPFFSIPLKSLVLKVVLNVFSTEFPISVSFDKSKLDLQALEPI